MSLFRLYLPIFQSTLPRRERRPQLVYKNFRHHFNPRSREGSDNYWENDATITANTFQSTLPRRERHVLFISIHAPAKGATAKEFTLEDFSTISIHAPAKGATRGGLGFSIHGTISIHAPAKGATIRLCTILFSSSISIHAPAKGATRSCWCWNNQTQFQSTLPRRERLVISSAFAPST